MEQGKGYFRRLRQTLFSLELTALRRAAIQHCHSEEWRDEEAVSDSKNSSFLALLGMPK
jgi:hypothetical protein